MRPRNRSRLQNFPCSKVISRKTHRLVHSTLLLGVFDRLCSMVYAKAYPHYFWNNVRHFYDIWNLQAHSKWRQIYTYRQSHSRHRSTFDTLYWIWPTRNWCCLVSNHRFGKFSCRNYIDGSKRICLVSDLCMDMFYIRSSLHDTCLWWKTWHHRVAFHFNRHWLCCNNCDSNQREKEKTKNLQNERPSIRRLFFCIQIETKII